MGDGEREPRSEAEMKRFLVGKLVDKRTAKWNAVEVETVQEWVPEYEEDVAVRVLMQLVAEETPVTWATPAETVQLSDLGAGQAFVEELDDDYVDWF
ncbi:MAG: hypothetical protein ABEI99_04080 [Halobaculum sp.]